MQQPDDRDPAEQSAAYFDQTVPFRSSFFPLCLGFDICYLALKPMEDPLYMENIELESRVNLRRGYCCQLQALATVCRSWNHLVVSLDPLAV